jgi:uncharacterized repeat protein (TIGR01451 family)/MYXO-CTERM domain-containing protein
VRRRIQRALLLTALSVLPARAAEEIRILNRNDPGEGFNDPTPATPVGGNPGKTVGEQRQIAFQYAAALWSAALGNRVRILIDARFSALQCGSTGTLLGAAGPNRTSAADDPIPALSNEQAGRDLDPSLAEISAIFNSFGGSGCSFSWYYGFDDTPSQGNSTNLISVLLHEFAHGLGLGSFADAYLAQARDSTTGRLLSDLQANDIVAFRAAAVRPYGVSWVGPQTKAITADFATGKNGVLRLANGETHPLIPNGWAGPIVSFNNVILVRAQDAGGSGKTNACAPIAPASGKLVIVDRDTGPDGTFTCLTVDRVMNVQNAGAVGVIIRNDEPGTIPRPFGGPPGGASIPVWSISLEDGTAVESFIGSGAQVTLDASAGGAGMDASGQLLLYTPSVSSNGSTLSHWDITATPDLLMEPFLGDVARNLDVTPAALADMGWDVPGGVSIGASKLLRPDIALGQPLSFVVQVVNRSGSPATGVVLDHVPDPGLSFTSGSGDCTSGFPCSLGTLEPWAVRMVVASYAATSPQLASVSQTFRILAANPAPVARAATTTVLASHLSLTLTGPKTGSSGQSGQYTLTLHNDGQDLVNSVVVEHLVSGPGTVGTIAGDCGGTATCRLPAVGPGETKRWTFTVSYTGIGTVIVTASTPGATAGTTDVQTVGTDVSAPTAKSGCSVASGPASAASSAVGLALLVLLASSRARRGRRSR